MPKGYQGISREMAELLPGLRPERIKERQGGPTGGFWFIQGEEPGVPQGS